MHKKIYFADVELPFHFWVREHKGDAGYRWVLREAHTGADRELRDEQPSPPAGDGTDGPSV
jgi:hypothetical protein